MNMFEMRLNSRSHIPPGLMRFKHPISGHEEAFHSWTMLRDWVTSHCAGNGYPPITDEEIEAQICERLGPATAKRYCSGDGISVEGVNLGWHDIWNGTKVIGSLLLAGRKLVSREEAERRAAICAPCSRNVDYNKPCGGDCPPLVQLVEEIVGADGTSRDAELLACSVCKCANKAQVWVPIEHLKHGVNEEMMPQFTPQCWKAAGIRALSDKSA